MRRMAELIMIALLLCSALPTASPFLSGSYPIGTFRLSRTLQAGGGKEPSKEPSNPDGADWDAILRSLECSYASPSAGGGADVPPKNEGVSADAATTADDVRAKVRERGEFDVQEGGVQGERTMPSTELIAT